MEVMLNENKAEPEIHESYYLTPEHFEKIFHGRVGRRTSSCDATINTRNPSVDDLSVEEVIETVSPSQE